MDILKVKEKKSMLECTIDNVYIGVKHPSIRKSPSLSNYVKLSNDKFGDL